MPTPFCGPLRRLDKPTLTRSLYRIELYSASGLGWQGAAFDVVSLDAQDDDFFDLTASGTLEGGSHGTDFLCLIDGCYSIELTGPADVGASFVFVDEESHRFSCPEVGCAEHFCVLDGDMYDRPTSSPSSPPSTAPPTTSRPSPAPSSPPSPMSGSVYWLEIASTGGWARAIYSVAGSGTVAAAGMIEEASGHGSAAVVLDDGCYSLHVNGSAASREGAVRAAFVDEAGASLDCGAVPCVVDVFCVDGGALRGAPTAAPTAMPTYAPTRSPRESLVSFAVVFQNLPTTASFPYPTEDCASNRTSGAFYNAAVEWQVMGELVFGAIIESVADASLEALEYVQCDASGAPLGANETTELAYTFRSAWSPAAVAAVVAEYHDGSAREAVADVVCEGLAAHGVAVSCAPEARRGLATSDAPTLDGLTRTEIYALLNVEASSVEVEAAVVEELTTAPSAAPDGGGGGAKAATSVLQAATSLYAFLAVVVLILAAVGLAVLAARRARHGTVDVNETKPPRDRAASAVEMSTRGPRSPKNVEFDDVFGGGTKKAPREPRRSLWKLASKPSLAPVEPRVSGDNPMARRHTTAHQESPRAAVYLQGVFRGSIQRNEAGIAGTNPMARRKPRSESAPVAKTPRPTVEGVFQSPEASVRGTNPMARAKRRSGAADAPVRGPALPPEYRPSSVKIERKPTWTEHEDPASGHRYYSNSVTGETSWTKPAEEEEEEEKKDHPVADVVNAWERRTDPASGAFYYYNAATGESTWTPPPPITEARAKV